MTLLNILNLDLTAQKLFPIKQHKKNQLHSFLMALYVVFMQSNLKMKTFFYTGQQQPEINLKEKSDALYLSRCFVS